MNWAYERKYRTVNIYSDSQSSIIALSNLYTRNARKAVVCDLILKYENFQGTEFKLEWVKKCAGITCNELAYLLPVVAHKLQLYYKGVSIPGLYIKKELRRDLLENWQGQWDCRPFSNADRKIDSRPWSFSPLFVQDQKDCESRLCM